MLNASLPHTVALLLFVAPRALSAQTLVREASRDSASGVPATRQPAPTDCATALRQQPANAKVVYGAAVGERPPPALARDSTRQASTPAPPRKKPERP